MMLLHRIHTVVTAYKHIDINIFDCPVENLQLMQYISCGQLVAIKGNLKDMKSLVDIHTQVNS